MSPPREGGGVVDVAGPYSEGLGFLISAQRAYRYLSKTHFSLKFDPDTPIDPAGMPFLGTMPEGLCGCWAETLSANTVDGTSLLK